MSMVILRKKKSKSKAVPKAVYIHNGKMHMDELLALGILYYKEIINEQTPVFRIAPKDVTSELKNNKDIYLIDVGGVYNPVLNNYDHHKTGVSHCAAMLIAQHFAPELFNNLILKNMLDIVNAIDLYGFKNATNMHNVPTKVAAGFGWMTMAATYWLQNNFTMDNLYTMLDIIKTYIERVLDNKEVVDEMKTEVQILYTKTIGNVLDLTDIDDYIKTDLTIKKVISIFKKEIKTYNIKAILLKNKNGKFNLVILDNSVNTNKIEFILQMMDIEYKMSNRDSFKVLYIDENKSSALNTSLQVYMVKNI